MSSSRITITEKLKKNNSTMNTEIREEMNIMTISVTKRKMVRMKIKWQALV